MKSIRFALLKCLQTHGEQTMDDLEMQLVEFQKNKIYSNLQAAKSEQLVSMRPDDVTRRPAYKITAKGKVWLSSKGHEDADEAPEAATTDTPSTELATVAPEAIKESLTTETDGRVIAITIAGPIGTGKTLIAREIDKALAGIGTPVRFEGEAEANEARNLTFGDLNKITASVVLRIEHELPVCCGAARVMATTAAEVSGEYRAQLDVLVEQNRLLGAENSALRSHSLMLGQISEITERHQQLSDSTPLDIVMAMAQRISDLESAVDLSQQAVHQLELEAEQHKERIATLESHGDLLDAKTRYPSYEALEIIANCTAHALEKAGFTEFDNPADPIELMSVELDGWRQLALEHGCSNPAAMKTADDAMNGELARLKAENLSLKVFNEAMPGFGAAHEAIKAGKPPFYVSIGRDSGPQIHKDIEPATRRMKSIVRRGDAAGLVLVPILKAIKGVEVVEVKAA